MRPEEFVSLYHSLWSDPKFEGIWHDPLGRFCYVEMLHDAEAAYPDPAAIPHVVPRRIWRLFVERDIIRLAPGGRYFVKALEAEREKRQRKAKEMARKRWGHKADKSADKLAEMAPSLREATDAASIATASPVADARTTYNVQRTTTTRSTQPMVVDASERDRFGTPHVDRETATVLEGITGRSYLTMPYKAAGTLDELCERHGCEKVRAAVQRVATRHNGTPPSWHQVVYGAMKVLDPILGSAELQPVRVQDMTSEQRKAMIKDWLAKREETA